MARSSTPTPDGERRVRGPRHRRPFLLRVTAFLHLVTRFAFLGTVIGIPASLIFRPDLLAAILFFPAVFAVSGFFWLICASKIGCRICAMRMFYSKKCVKSRKAPSWPLIGPHTTLAVLALFSRSVRCPYCGTPNELAEKDDG